MIPGHGGVTDRLDCQIIIGTFTYFYLHTFLRAGSNSINYWLNTMSMEMKKNLYDGLVIEFKRFGIPY